MMVLFNLSNSKQIKQDKLGENILMLEEILKGRVGEVKEYNSQTFSNCKNNFSNFN